MKRLISLAIALLLVAALAVDRAGAQSADQSTSEEIIVTAARAEEIAHAYASEIAAAPAAEDQYARWNDRVCPSVAGLTPTVAQDLIDHLARRANAVGLTVEPSGCNPNLVIVFAPDADLFAREVVDRRRELLGYYSEDDVVTSGREALEAFASTPEAVRWWHVVYTVSADGQVLSNTRSRVGRGTRDAVAAAQGAGSAAAQIGNGFEGVEAVRSQGSRMRRNTRQDVSFVLVIVDNRRIQGVPASAMADYLTMASLVQLDPGADMSPFSTILNLFAAREQGVAPPQAMTTWDEAYLAGLYGMTREAANSRQQRAEIARRAAREIVSQ